MPFRLSLVSLLFILLAGACQVQAASLPVETLASQSVIVTTSPSASPAPSATPLRPTETPLPTATLEPSPTPEAITTLLFTGVIVPARCVQAAIDASGNPDLPYEEVSSLIAQADLAVGTLNATISDYPPHTGCVPTYVLVGSAENADALRRAGFDVMSVATNHIKNCGLTNCGDRAFFDTLENLRRVSILPVGAGKNHAEAMQPVVVTVNGIRFAIVSLGQIEPMAFAGEDKPGIAILNKENLEAAIAEAKKVSDVVIAMPHWGPEDMAVPTWLQRNLAQQLVDAGADLVVGNHTHVVQALQEINGVPVFYGLGNFVFDQTWADDHQQGVILLVKFKGKEYQGFELIPTHVDGDGRVHIAGESEASEIMQRIEAASQAIK
jgi:poly-gamma-glutamate capsule biosynthesis protein CapA/YwtB (metallophosphatase superfamily)